MPRIEPATSRTDPPHAGWRERADLPDWNVRRILTKLDTGAWISAVHVERLERVGPDRVRFALVTRRPSDTRPERSVQVEAPLVRMALVRSSTGQTQHRPVVATRVRLGPVERVVELSLVSRRQMRCRMLLGRAALGGLVVVDPNRTYVLTSRPARRAGDGSRRDEREPPTPRLERVP